MNVNSLVWVKNPEFKDAAVDHLWLQSAILEKHLTSNMESVALNVKIYGRDYVVKMAKNAVESDTLKPRDADAVATTDDIQYLKHINEPEVINLLKLRYELGMIFTYSGGVLMYVNPFDQVRVSSESNQFLEDFVRKIVISLSNRADKSGKSHTGISRSKSLYSMTPKLLKNIAHKDSIIISGESGSGKSECYRMILHSLLEPTTILDSATIEDLKINPALSPISSPHVSMKPSVLSKSMSGENGEILHTDSLEGLGVTHGHTTFVEKVLLCNRILESFGNARTLHTKDSSRFAKLVELVILPKESPSLVANRPFGGEVIGATVKTYLLESSRTSTQQLQERNFNIFYELLAGWDSGERLKFGLLGTSGDYHYTNQGKVLTTYSAEAQALYNSDAEKFFQLNDSLLSLNFSSSMITSLYHIIAGILMMGEINFNESGDLLLSDEMLLVENFGNPLVLAATLLGLDIDVLKSLLTAKTISTPNGDVIQLSLQPAQSRVARDGIVKQIYKNLFDFIVEAVNNKLEQIGTELSGSNDNVIASLRAILILDIFGFDSFEKNSIDQLCINYANEALQQQFNSYIFKSEIENYEEEGLDFDKIEFSDNKDSLELIGNGIFRVLDDQCRLPHPTDKRFLARIYKEFETHSNFAVSKLQSGRSQFTIVHFAGQVEYTADDFIEKNIDNTPPETGKILADSTNELLSEVYTQVLTAEATNSAVTPTNSSGLAHKRGSIVGKINTTLTGQFKTELQVLMQEITATKPHYIRCIKPTEPTWTVGKSNNYWFSQAKVAEQLKYCGIMDGFRFTKSKMTFMEFFNRYRVIASAVFHTAASLPYFLSDGTEKDHKKPLKVYSIDEIREFCKELLDLFAIHNESKIEALKDTKSTIKAVGAAPPKDATSAGFKNPLATKRPPLKKSFSRSSTPSKNKLIKRQSSGSLFNTSLINFDVDVFMASDGIINTKQVLIGNTKIFLPPQEHDYLEVCRVSCLTHMAQLIRDSYLMFIHRRTFIKARSAARVIQRKFRNVRARFMRIRRLAAVVTMQRRFRRFTFMKKIIRIQCLFRLVIARATLKYFQEQKQELLKAYGQFIVARDMRTQRRAMLSAIEAHVLQPSTVDGEVTSPANSTAVTKVDHYITIPALESRLSEYTYQDDSLTRAISSVKSDMTISLSTSNNSEDDLSDDGTDHESSVRLSNRSDVKNGSSVKSTVHNMGYEELLHFWELCLQLLKFDNSSSTLNDIKLKSNRVFRQFQPAGKLLKADALVDFSVIGKYMGVTVWKITALQQDKNIPPLTITQEHPLFEGIQRLIEKIKKIEELCQQHGDTENSSTSRKKKKNGSASVASKKSGMSRIGKVLEELTYACSGMRKYYEDYVREFVNEYGNKSTFATAFSKSPASYLFAVLKIIKLEKKYKNEKQESHKHQQKRNSKLSNPLTFDWSTNPTVVAHHSGSPSHSPEKQTRRYIKIAGATESDTLRKLAEVDESKNTLNLHSLRIIEYNGFSYQFMPAAPGIDHAVNSFRSLMIGEIPRVKKLFKILGNHQNMGKIAYYSVTSNILARNAEGKAENNHNNSLMDVLYDPVSIEQIESVSFSSTIIACCIFGLLQLQPNHVMVNFERRGIRDTQSRAEKRELASSLVNQEMRNVKFVGINGDESVYNSFLHFKNPLFNKLHADNVNVLFFLPQMDEPIDPHIRQFFLNSPFIAEEMIINWLRDIFDHNQHYLDLLETAKRKQQKNQGVSRPQDFNADDFQYLKLPLQLPKGSLVELSKRIKHITKFLQSTEPGVLPTPSLLFREFYPLLSDFYEDMRLHSDFKENIGMDGVISYAYAYHRTVNVLRDNYPVLPQSQYGESFSLGSDIGPLRNGAHHPPTPGIASKLSNLFKKSNQSNGAFNDQFWQGVEHVEEDETDGLSGNEEQVRKRKALRKEQKKGAQQKKGDAQKKQKNETNGSPDGRPARAHSVRFGFDEVYEEHGEIVETKFNGKERGILKTKTSAYVDYGEVYDEEVNESGVFEASKSTIVLQGPLQSAGSFNMGDVYDKPQSFFQAPESLFIIDNLPPPEESDYVRSPVVTYGDIYECQSQFSMSESTFLQTPAGENDQSSEANISAAKRREYQKKASAGSFDFYDVYEDKRNEDEVLEDIPTQMKNTRASIHNSDSTGDSQRARLEFDFEERKKPAEKYPEHLTAEDIHSSNAGTRNITPFIPLAMRQAVNGTSPMAVAPKTYDGEEETKRSPKKNSDSPAGRGGQRSQRRKSLTNRPHSQSATQTLLPPDQRDKLMYLQRDEVKSLYEASHSSNAPSTPDAAAKHDKLLHGDVEYVSVVDEITEFVKSLDFKFIRESYQKIAHKYEEKIDYSLRLCKLIGKNLSFLPSITLQNINELQLKVMFKSFIRGNLKKKTPNEVGTPNGKRQQQQEVHLTLQTKELILRYDYKEEMYEIKKSSVLYYLKKDYDLDIKLIATNDVPYNTPPLSGGLTIGSNDTAGSDASKRSNRSPVRMSIMKDASGDQVMEMVNPLAKRPMTSKEKDYEESILIHYELDDAPSPNKPMFFANSPKRPSGKGFEGIARGESLDRRDSIDNAVSYDDYERVIMVNKSLGRTISNIDEMKEDELKENSDLKERLLKILMSCSNLMNPPISAANAASGFALIQEARNKIDIVKKVIHYLSTPSLHRFQPLENKTLSIFEQILLDYPALAPIASLLVEKNAFINNLLYVNKLIEHKHVERFIDLILKMIYKHPDVLILVDSDGYLPCDRIRAISNTDGSKGHLKYPLLTKIVNYAGAMNQRHLQSVTRGGTGIGIFSQYREEEELIVLATHLDFIATEEELTSGFYQFTKKDKFGISLLLKTIINELFSMNEEEKELAINVYELMIRSIERRKRMTAGPPRTPGSNLTTPRGATNGAPLAFFSATDKEKDMLMDCLTLSDEVTPLVNNVDWKFQKLTILDDSTIYQRFITQYPNALIEEKIRSYFDLIITLSS